MAYPVAMAVSSGAVDRGILVCGSGIGMSMASNKVKGVRAALVHDEVGADISRRHNDANVLCLPADMLGQQTIEQVVAKWLRTEFEGGRHARRVNKITAIEQGLDPTDAGALESMQALD
jgi:ribose 5-phosphate isomerase B